MPQYTVCSDIPQRPWNNFDWFIFPKGGKSPLECEPWPLHLYSCKAQCNTRGRMNSSILPGMTTQTILLFAADCTGRTNAIIHPL